MCSGTLERHGLDRPLDDDAGPPTDIIAWDVELADIDAGIDHQQLTGLVDLIRCGGTFRIDAKNIFCLALVIDAADHFLGRPVGWRYDPASAPIPFEGDWIGLSRCE